MKEAHDDLADRLELARRQLVEDHLEASRLGDHVTEPSMSRVLRALKASLRGDGISSGDVATGTERDDRRS